MIAIALAQEDDLSAFFVYLNAHIRENGRDGAPLFQPLPRGTEFGPEREQAFRKALSTDFGQPGWRRLWLARHADGRIAGHIDLRGRPESQSHRMMLGMGVDGNVRRQGLGSRLLETAAAWAREHGADWLDLEVLAGNLPARALYQRSGFTETGCIPDMFRIDGDSHDYVLMSRRLISPRSGTQPDL